jgi:hypothetical protein
MQKQFPQQGRLAAAEKAGKQNQRNPVKERLHSARPSGWPHDFNRLVGTMRMLVLLTDIKPVMRSRG